MDEVMFMISLVLRMDYGRPRWSSIRASLGLQNVL